MNLYYCRLKDKNIIEYGTINQLYKPVSKTTILKYGHIDNWTKAVITSDIEHLYIIFDLDFNFNENSEYKDKINILHDLKARIRQDKLNILTR